LAVFSESAGSLVNEDGISQYAQKAIYRNQNVPTVIEWIDRLKGAIL
jgi:hypothetical protein